MWDTSADVSSPPSLGLGAAGSETDIESILCNRASAAFDARGARSLFSRIVSSAATTRSRAASAICGHHPKFVARLQTIFDTDLSNFEFARPIVPKIHAGFASPGVDPANALRNSAPFIEAPPDVSTVLSPRALLFSGFEF